VPGCVGRHLSKLRRMKFTFLPHARERMERFGISEAEVSLVVGQPDQEGAANFGRLYAQKVIGSRTARVIYNRGRTRP
jgi:hypothetical protein